MSCGERCGGFCSEIIQLGGGYTIINTFNYLLGNKDRLNMLWRKAVAKFLNPGGDLVEFHRLFLAISFDYEHTTVWL